jgi:hypothetical protein
VEGEIKNALKIIVGTSEGKRPFGRHNRRWENNIKINFRKKVTGLSSSHGCPGWRPGAFLSAWAPLWKFF